MQSIPGTNTGKDEMNEQLIAAARSLESKAEASKAKALAETNAASAANDNMSLKLALLEGMRSSIYAEVAASLREAAQ